MSKSVAQSVCTAFFAKPFFLSGGEITFKSGEIAYAKITFVRPMQIIKYYMLNVRQGPNASEVTLQVCRAVEQKQRAITQRRGFPGLFLYWLTIIHIILWNNKKGRDHCLMGNNGFNLETGCNLLLARPTEQIRFIKGFCKACQILSQTIWQTQAIYA